MPRFERLTATGTRSVRPGLQRVLLADGSDAYALTDLCGPVSEGDELLVNSSALELGLGSGGAHVVHANLSAPYCGAPDAGRVMKARYLSVQLGVASHEEPGDGTADSGGLAEMPSLAGVRVALCVLHSHALALAAAAREAAAQPPGYVMTDGGALPFVLSDLAAACLEAGVIATAVSAGQAFGAPLEAVTVASGVAALAQRGIDRVVVAPGPGHLGTASPLGFAALDSAGHAAVLTGLGAATALAARASSQDRRERHRGISHHARAIAALSPSQTVVPVPLRHAEPPGAASDPPAPPDPAAEAQAAAWVASLGERAVGSAPLDVAGALARCGLEVTTMGRPLAEDAQACEWLGAAAAWLAAAP